MTTLKWCDQLISEELKHAQYDSKII